MTKYSLTIPLPSLHRPVDVKRGNATQAKTTARYPVRSGPKQFASYLSDMGSLIVEILSGTMMVSIGTAEIPHLGQLSPTRSIIGFFPIISPTEEKIGDLHVALVIESLMGRYIIAKWVALQISPEVIKLFSCSAQVSMKFSLLINMKMPTIVGIFIFISWEIFLLSYV